MPYVLKISRSTIDKLGVKLYDKVSAVLAELVANAYDADAVNVIVLAPMDQRLATGYTTKNRERIISDKGLTISVVDDGHGMNPTELQDFYLQVGADRHLRANNGKITRKGRRVMGRKGVGKLAPFGICNVIEVITSGIANQEEHEEGGTPRFVTAHIILQKNDVIKETDEDYEPLIGNLDGTPAERAGTTIILRDFVERKVPSIVDLQRQIATRFGLERDDWSVVLKDNSIPLGEPPELNIGNADIDLLLSSKIEFSIGDEGSVLLPAKRSTNGETELLNEIKSGFVLEDSIYPIKGWMAFAAKPSTDELIKGVRIYCNGKIAAQTVFFGQNTSFQGFYDVQNYLVGQIHCDFLDEDEDLIQTDRRDILWSSMLGTALSTWGIGVIKHMGHITRNPLKAKRWQEFTKSSDFHNLLERRVKKYATTELKEHAVEMAKILIKGISDEDVTNPSITITVANLAIDLSPNKLIVAALRNASEAAAKQDGSEESGAFYVKLLDAARIGQYAAIGQIAHQRLAVIELLNGFIENKSVNEDTMQETLAKSPWLIDPSWTPLTQNAQARSMVDSIVREFDSRVKAQRRLRELKLEKKRPDFVFLDLLTSDLHTIEIKRPGHAFSTSDAKRFFKYFTIMKEVNVALGYDSKNVVVHLICDEIKLVDEQKQLFDEWSSKRQIRWMKWTEFVDRTTRVHREFDQFNIIAPNTEDSHDVDIEGD